MATKILTGTYSAGYLLASPITTLSIASSGYVEGTGVTTPAHAAGSYAVVNDGRIREADANQANALYLGHGGSVTNGGSTDFAARIEGWRGVRIENTAGAVTNFGTIVGDVRSGVLLKAGGSVVNGSGRDTGALIEGGTAGVGISGAPGTVTNFGTIVGEALLPNGGAVTNGSTADTGALILAVAPYDGVSIGPVGTVTNFGRIENRGTAPSEVGVLLNGAGLSNGSAADTVALIYGYSGVEALAVAKIANFGTIEGTGAGGCAGVLLDAGGVLANGGTLSSSALIAGATGVYAKGPGATVGNYGTITGTMTSVKFGSASDVLIADGGARFVGQIAGGGGTLVVRGGAGTISGLGGAGVLTGAVSGDFAGFGAYVIGKGGPWTLAGFNAIAAEQSLTVDGSLTVGGTLSLAATRATIAVADGGLLTFSGRGSALAGTITGAGSVNFAGGTDTFNGTHLSAAVVTIDGAAVTLKGTLVNGGAVSVATPALQIGAGGATLSGGTWALSDNASNKVTGLAAGDTLTNASATISGAGMLGAGQMVLINRSAATIDGNGGNALIINTGASRIANSGLIEAAGAGGVTIQSAVLNAGKLEANGGTLTVNGAVSGPGSGVIASGALVFNSTFAENVTFTGAGDMLGLAKSQSYTGAITGFAKTGGTSLDLRDIGFVSSTEATYSGTASGGTLTVSDGSHTAHILLKGDYTASNFIASSDNSGGVVIVDPAGPPQAHRFIAAAAALGGAARPSAVNARPEDWRAPVLSLARRGAA